VGNNIEFTVHIEKPDAEKDGIGSFCVYEKFGNMEGKIVRHVKDIDTEIEGNRISAEGNIEYYLGYSIPSRVEVISTIFTAKVQNWDAVINQWLLLLMGAIMGAIFGGFFTVLLGILLGFLKINPALILTW